MGKIYEIYGDDAHTMTMALMQAADVAGMIPAGSSIGLKPNLVVAGTPESGATTHPGVLSGAIEYLQSNGFQDICVMEGSWVGAKTERAAHTCGYDKVCRTYHVPFYDLKEDKARRVDTPFGPMAICSRALDIGFLINLPVLKGHCQTVMTCALKNCKGCIPDREKRRFHEQGLTRPIAALAATLKPPLTIVDSICGDLNFEEGGTPVYTNRMLLGTDPVQIDAYGCKLMGLTLQDVPYIALAEKWGAGSAQLQDSDIVPLNDPASVSVYPTPTGLVARLTSNVQEKSACSACYASLVRAMYIANNHGTRPKQPVAIGQGWRNTAFDGLGIGNCCRHAKKFVQGCPPTADAIYKMF